MARFVAIAALEEVVVGAVVGAVVWAAPEVVGAELDWPPPPPPTLALKGSLVPQLSLMLVVQFFWPLAFPTFASLQTSKAFWQMN